ncbi:MAG: 50S ribosomal protein L7Ae-like protein [Firmicutes bacterium]|nr:50S ribosomal protein L7Ae-like protein [Bacillota bacterium]
MAIPELQSDAKLTIGSKQTRLALENNQAAQVFIAEDAELRVVKPIADICQKKGIPVIKVVSMRELGKACGIQVGAAAAAVIK